MWVMHTWQAFQLTFLPVLLLEQPTAYKDLSARVPCKLAPVLVFSYSNKSHCASRYYVNKHASPCLCVVPDQRKPNVRHVRVQRWWMLHKPPAQHLTHSLARRPETPSFPRPGAAKDPIGPPSCQSVGKRCGTCPQMTSVSEAVPAKTFSDWHQRCGNPVRLQSSTRP